MTTSSQQRFHELESRFMELEDKLSNTPEKEAISILHAMLQESLRTGSFHPSGNEGKMSFWSSTRWTGVQLAVIS